jgi:hypothetical protein
MRARARAAASTRTLLVDAPLDEHDMHGTAHTPCEAADVRVGLVVLARCGRVAAQMWASRGADVGCPQVPPLEDFVHVLTKMF